MADTAQGATTELTPVTAPLLDWVRGLVAGSTPPSQQLGMAPVPSKLSALRGTPVVQQPLDPLLQRLGLVPGGTPPYQARLPTIGVRG